ncbi:MULTISPECIES: hypothetical protein [Agrobacterium]|uniref:Glycosyl hydrolase family 32 N-terminal domain-containing protein n=1 Tax=Agrobacterium tumefaciens TaxID=358 RepID=A0AAE6EG98_AGRTU|nr:MULTISPECIES: hypothetical protein [Agrobacterium]QCL75025.1 hypothetical protein CFBP5499_15970 [Agrobacterium tumefaciens]QCL80585.1 hypothetical protein CFBP5877_15505 [Agrobacterium tumefaciens]CUX63255.1 conserved hypothetical protein [Agrobacterium sp. NCPPB 925]
MAWRRRGRLFDAETMLPHHPQLRSHAANPLAVNLEGDLYRVFFSARNSANRSSVGAVDIDVVRRTVERVITKPVIAHGPEGRFDADGISVGCLHKDATGARYVLFMGWQAPNDGHWRGDIGRLRLGDDLSLTPDPAGPYIGSDTVDPISLSYPWVHRTVGGYLMWYGSTVTWDAGNGEMLHVLREARSEDGINWRRDGKTLPYFLGVAQAFSRPTVVQDAQGVLQMWYSFRGAPGKTYRIGHAVRRPGAEWTLQHLDGGLDVAHDGWDSEMVEYPFVFDHGGERLMLYNGNGFGRSGFGLAVWEE